MHPDRILLAQKIIGVKFDPGKGQRGHNGKTGRTLMNFGNITGQKKVKFEHEWVEEVKLTKIIVR